MMAVYDSKSIPKEYGTWKWKITANKRIADLKWAVRDRFNPRGKDGGMSHQHVIHCSNNADLFFTPYFLPRPAVYSVATVDLATLQIGCAVTSGKCASGGSVKIVDSPHYAFASGDTDAWLGYFTKGRLAGSLTEDHLVAAFRELQEGFASSGYPRPEL